MLSWPNLTIALVLLIFVSGFFSGSETAMMALNRYRLRHRARKGDSKAEQILLLLKRTDRLLGTILLGNTFANVLASSVTTLLAVHYFNDVGLVLAPIVLTLVILIAAETAPKRYAAVHSEHLAKRSVGLLSFFSRLFSPLVYVVNAVANFGLRVFRINLHPQETDALSADELSQVVRDASPSLKPAYQQMLLRVLELESVTVDDVMIPMSSVASIDLARSLDDIMAHILMHQHRYWPVYHEDEQNILGIVSVHKLVRSLLKQPLTESLLRSLLEDVYYIPEATPVSKQLNAFQANQAEVGLVVDEYGEVLGLVTMQDIVEEIVGDFAGQMATAAQKIQPLSDGALLVDGTVSIRDFNRLTPFQLPLNGPKTLSGFLIDGLGVLPSGPFSLISNDALFEVLSLDDNTISEVKVMER